MNKQLESETDLIDRITSLAKRLSSNGIGKLTHRLVELMANPNRSSSSAKPVKPTEETDVTTRGVESSGSDDHSENRVKSKPQIIHTENRVKESRPEIIHTEKQEIVHKEKKDTIKKDKQGDKQMNTTTTKRRKRKKQRRRRKRNAPAATDTSRVGEEWQEPDPELHQKSKRAKKKEEKNKGPYTIRLLTRIIPVEKPSSRHYPGASTMQLFGPGLGPSATPATPDVLADFRTQFGANNFDQYGSMVGQASAVEDIYGEWMTSPQPHASPTSPISPEKDEFGNPTRSGTGTQQNRFYSPLSSEPYVSPDPSYAISSDIAFPAEEHGEVKCEVYGDKDISRENDIGGNHTNKSHGIGNENNIMSTQVHDYQ